MGVYSIDTHGATNIPVVEADMSYHGAAGAQRILAECYQNDLAFFEGVIANDFKTAVGLREGTILESEMQAITEGTISGFFGKLKELIKKVWAKIKGLIKNFMIKINAICTGDNKKLVNKYKKEVLKKDLSKMKFKWSKPTGNEISYDKLDKDVTIRKELPEDKEDIYKDNLYKSMTNGKCDSEDFSKEVHEYLFDDEDEYEGLSDAGTSVSELISVLTNSSTAVKDITKSQSKIDKLYKNILKDIDKEEKDIIKRIPEDKNAEKELTALHNYQRRINALNTCTTDGISADMAACKFHIAQCRRVFIKAATYNPKSVKEDAIYVEAACEVSDNELEDAIATAPTAAEKDAYDAAAREGKLDPTGDVGPQDGSI